MAEFITYGWIWSPIYEFNGKKKQICQCFDDCYLILHSTVMAYSGVCLTSIASLSIHFYFVMKYFHPWNEMWYLYRNILYITSISGFSLSWLCIFWKHITKLLFGLRNLSIFSVTVKELVKTTRWLYFIQLSGFTSHKSNKHPLYDKVKSAIAFSTCCALAMSPLNLSALEYWLLGIWSRTEETRDDNYCTQTWNRSMWASLL